MKNINQSRFSILIVDDDKLLTLSMTKFFSSHNVKVTVFQKFCEAYEFLSGDYTGFDLLILDINLLDGNGIELLELFRSKNDETPVIMLSANTDENVKITSLDIGADDYICKPFSLNELFSRINAILRRCAKRKPRAGEDEADDGILNCPGLCIDTRNRSVTVDGEKVKLRFIEFELIKLFVLKKNSIVKSEKILEEIWKDGLVDKKTIEPHISRLRKKLGPYGARIEVITNVGYRFNTANMSM